MTVILKASGFKNLESLQDFSNRFPNISNHLDSELEKVWISHKNIDNIPKWEAINFDKGLSYSVLFNAIKKKIKSSQDVVSLLTEFDAITIFDKIYKHFNRYLSSYIFTKCYIFYNWGLNAFEPLIDHFKIYKQIENSKKKFNEIKKKKCRANELERVCYKDVELKLNQNASVTTCKKTSKCAVEESVDMFAQVDCSHKYPAKQVTLKSVKNAIEKSEPFCNMRKNANDPTQETFNLKKILYDMKQRSQWPKNHILSQKNVDELLMFIIKLPGKASISIESKLVKDCMYWNRLRSILSVIIKKHEEIERNNGYGRILKRHLKQVKTAPGGRLTPIEKSIVSSYIIDILRKVVPIEFFGQNRFRKKFFCAITKIINSSKEENLIWHPFLHILLKNKANFLWCGEMTDNYTQYVMVIKICKWLVIDYVFVILRNNFYITETGSSGFGLRFYRKSDMESASSVFLNKLLYYRHLKLLKHRERFVVEQKWIDTGIIDGREFDKDTNKILGEEEQYRQPIASIRFLPKCDGSDRLRIISNIRNRKTKVLTSCQKSEELSTLFVERCARRKKKLFYVKLFLEFLVERTKTGIEPVPNNPTLEAAWSKAIYLKRNFGKLYFVKADIADAFDSVIHDILFQVLHSAIQEEQKKIQLKKIIEWKRIHGQLQKSVRFSFSNKVRENCVLINRSVHLHREKKIPKIKNSELLNILKQVAMEQRIEIKGKLYKLIKGLAQGSAGKFSPQLCEIYYSAMDRSCFGDFMNRNDSILLRGVDDYLFITSDIKKCKAFLEKVRNGIRRFNARFNGDKLKSNLIEDIQDVVYLGLIFNFEDMSVKPNYSKYQGKDVLDTMKLTDYWGNVHYKKNIFLQRRALRINSLKLQPILLSSNHNTRKTIRQIVFQACLMQSIRVMVLAKHLYQNKSKNELVVSKILLMTCTRIENSIKHYCNILKMEVKWLFLAAAVNIFRKYSGQFKCLLTIMRFCLEKCEKGIINSGGDFLLNFLRHDIEIEENWTEVKKNFGSLAILTKPYRRIRES